MNARVKTREGRWGEGGGGITSSLEVGSDEGVVGSHTLMCRHQSASSNSQHQHQSQNSQWRRRNGNWWMQIAGRDGGVGGERKQCGPHRRLDRGNTIVHGTVRDPIIDGGWVHGCGVRPHMRSGVEVIEGVVLQKEEAKGEEPPKSHFGGVGETKERGDAL